MVWTTSTYERSLVVSTAQKRSTRTFGRLERLARPFTRLRTAPLAAVVNGLVMTGLVVHWLAQRSSFDPADPTTGMGESLTFGALVLAGLATCMLMIAADPASGEASLDAADAADRQRPAAPLPPSYRSPLPLPDGRLDAETHFVGLMAEMSHELRTPLNVIIGFSDMMHRELLGPLGAERYKSYAGHIRESGFALVKAVDDTLALTRLIARTDRDCLVPVAVHAILRNAAVNATPEATEGRVRLILPDTADHVVLAESAALEQAVANLLQNAVASAPRDGTVTIDCGMQGGTISITITINRLASVASGLAGESPPRSVDASRLRVAIARALIELQGGYVDEHFASGGAGDCRITLPSGAH